MIARVETPSTGERKRRSAQCVEVRVVVDVRLPEWLQSMQPNGLASIGPAISQAVATVPLSVVQNQLPPNMTQENGVLQEANRPSFVVTSTEPIRAPDVTQTQTMNQHSTADQAAETTAPTTLLELYRKEVMPKKLRSAGKKAIAEHLSSCRAFDQFRAAKIDDRLSTPMVNLFKTHDLLRSFAQWMVVDSDLSVVTAAKRLTHVTMVAKLCHSIALDKPTDKELRRIEDGRPVKRALRDGRRIPSFEEVNSLASSVGVSRWPYGLHAPYFWRGLIRLAAFVGFRTYDIVSLIPEKTGLCKSDVIWESLCPIADVTNALGYELHSPHGWLHYSIEKDKHSDNRKILLPMPKWLRDWIRFFFELSKHSERVFPSMKRLSLDTKTFGLTWKKIREKAKVDPRIMLSEGTGDVIAVRKYAANWWHLATLRAKNDSALADKMSHYVLHHAEVTTANKHYLNVQASVLPVMLELMQAWPLPAADSLPVSMLPE